jgi:hypothetical protein
MSFLGLTGFAGIPSIRDIQETVEAAITFGPWEYNRAFISPIMLSGAARDTGSTPTSLLRPGLLLGRITASNLFKEWNPTGTDGSQEVAAILLWAMDTQYLGGNDNKWMAWALFGGHVKAKSVVVPGETNIGLTVGNNARYARKLMSSRFMFDDFYHQNKPIPGLGGWDKICHVTADTTLTAADDNTLYTNKGAAGKITFTLPAVAASKGLRFGFLGVTPQELCIAGPAATTLNANGSLLRYLHVTGATCEGSMVEVLGIDGAIYQGICHFGDLNVAVIDNTP